MGARQLSLLAAEAGIALAAKKLERPDGEAWMADALHAIEVVARRQATLTTDDVWTVLGEDSDYRSQMGNAMRAAKSLGLIERAPGWHISERPTRHRNTLRVWTSKLFRGAEQPERS